MLMISGSALSSPVWCSRCYLYLQYNSFNKTQDYQGSNMHAHHEVSLWSSGSCHSRGRYCLSESRGPSAGKEPSTVYSQFLFLVLVQIIMQCAFKFWSSDTHTQFPAEKLKCSQTGRYCGWTSRLTDSWKTSSTSCLMTLAGGGRMEALCWDSQASRMELRFTLRWARSSHMLRRRLFRWSLNWTGWEGWELESHYNNWGVGLWWHSIKNDSLVSGFPPDFEVGENQLTSRESYPVNTPASVQQNNKTLPTNSTRFTFTYMNYLYLCLMIHSCFFPPNNLYCTITKSLSQASIVVVTDELCVWSFLGKVWDLGEVLDDVVTQHIVAKQENFIQQTERELI